MIVAPWAERLGGGEVMLSSFLRRLSSSRLDPALVFMQAGPAERDAAALGLRTHVVHGIRLRNGIETTAAVWGLAKLIRTLRPDLIVSWAAKSHLYVGPAALLSGHHPRLVWWQHSITTGHWMDRVATILPAVAVGCSSSAAANAQAKLRPRRRVFVVHPGVEKQPMDSAPRHELRRALGLPEDSFLAGVVGRLQPDKGQDRFVRALALLVARGHDLHGVVVGGDAHGLSPRYAAALQALVAEARLEGTVTLTGQVPDATPYIRAMDVLVNASAAESFGIAIVEAMMLGVPIINAAKGGPEEIIEADVAGVMLDSRDPAVIADALEELMLDGSRRARISAEAQRRADRFTADEMARQLEASLLEIAA
jgi:glycosyltransferase involved in cell wall biosynthesis